MSRYIVVVAESAVKEMKAIPKASLEKIGKAIDRLAETPRPRGSIKLKGNLDLYRIRVGSYRVVYTVSDKTVTVVVVRVRHRKDAYYP